MYNYILYNEDGLYYVGKKISLYGDIRVYSETCL